MIPTTRTHIVRALKLLLWAASVGAALLVSLVLLLQVDPVSTAVGRWAADAFSPPSLEIGVDKVTGSWVRGLEVTGLSVSSSSSEGAGQWHLEADTLRIGYALLPLLRRTLSLSRVEGAGVRFDLRLAPAGGGSAQGDGPEGQAGAGLTPTDSAGSSWVVLAAVVRLSDAESRVWEGDVPPASDDPWVFSGGRATVRDLRVGPGLTLTLDTLLGAFRPAGQEAPWGRVAVSGRLGPDGIRLDTLLLESPASHLSAGGILPLGFQSPAPGTMDLRLRADPLDLRDLGPLLPPMLADSLPIVARGRVTLRDGAYTAELEADAGSGGRLEARGRVAMDAGQRPSSGEVRLTGVDLRAWGLTESALVADLAMDARADSLRGGWKGSWSTSARGLDARGDFAFSPGARDEGASWRVAGEGTHHPAAGGPLLPALDSLDFGGSFRWTGEGLSMGELAARGEIRVDSIRRGAVRLAGAVMDGEVEARGSGITLRSRISLSDSAWIHLAGAWETGEGESRVRVDSMEFSRVDARSFLATADSTPVPRTLLNGSFAGLARGVSGDWSGEGTLHLDSTSIGTQRVREGRVRMRGNAREGEVRLELAFDQGDVQGEIRMAGWGPDGTLTVPDLTFRELDLAPFMGEGARTTRLSGRLEGETRDLRPARAVGRLLLVLDSSTVADRTVSAARLELGADAGEVDGEMQITALGGRLILQGEGDLGGARPTYSATGTLQYAAPDTTGDRQGALFAHFGLSGEGTRPDSLDGTLWMEVDSAHWEGVTLESGRLEAHASAGVLELDTLSLESEAVTLSGGGRLPFSATGEEDGELTLEGRILRAGPFARWVNAQTLAVGEATFQAEARGTLSELELTGTGNIDALLLDRYRAQRVELHAEGHRSAAEGLTRGTARLAVDRLETPFFPVRRLDAEGSLEEGREVAIDASAVIDDSRDARLSMRLEDLPDSLAIRLERFEFRADRDQWTLAEPTRIGLAGGMELDSLLLTAGEQEIRAHGRLAREGPVDLRLGVEGFRIGTFSELLGHPSLQGSVSGSLAFGGDAGNPRFDAHLESHLESPRAPPSDVGMTLAYEGRTLEIDGAVGMSGERGLDLAGTLPFRLSLVDSEMGLLEGEEMDLGVTADSLPLSWLEPFLPEESAREIKGTLNGSVRLKGLREDPRLDGTLALADGGVRLPALGVTYRRGRGRILFQGEQIVLDSLRVRSGGGSMTATGTISLQRLEELEYDFLVAARSFQAVKTPAVNATLSGDLRVSGTSLHPSVAGNVVVRRADFYLEELVATPRVEDVALTEEDYQELARVFSYQQPSGAGTTPAFLQGIALDLNVDLRRDSWLRQRSNPEMAVQFSGNLRVRKEAGDSLRLIGEVDAVPSRSYVEQFGRRFSLVRGGLVFQGAPMATQVDIRTEFEVPSRDNPEEPEVVIALAVSGTPDDLTLELSSSPPLEASDMVSYLAIGRPADRTLGGGESSLSETGGALALGQLSGAVEAYAREEVGLDVVEITTEGTEGVILLAGRYISPDLYLGIRQPVSLHRTSGEASDRTADSELEVEYQAVRWLLLNLQAGGRSGIELFVRFRISYE